MKREKHLPYVSLSLLLPLNQIIARRLAPWDSSQQGPSADIGSAGLESSNAERSPSTPNSPRLRTGKRVLRPTTGQASRPSKRNPSHKDGHLASASPRRSKRIQPPVSSVAKDPAKPASTDPSKRAVRSKPERKVASNRATIRSSAKPQGVSKGQPAKTTRGKARKK